MKNLAGNKDCDYFIREELRLAGIEAAVIDNKRHEVPSTVGGRLTCDGKEIVLHRAWYYWVARGPVPLELARKMYSDPVGQKDVRVDGHCGCPPPEHPWIEAFDADGKRLSIDKDGSDEAGVSRLFPGELASYHFVRTREEYDRLTARAHVDTYHIDSQEGLNLFANSIREWNARLP